MDDRFKNKMKNEAMVMNEIREMKLGGTLRSIVLVRMRFLKNEVFSQGRRNNAESSTGATNWSLKENPVD